MKKEILFISLIPLLALTGCGKEKGQLKILCPTGAPAIPFFNFANDDNFETTGDPQAAIIPSFQLGTYDVLVAPTQGGLNQIVNQHANFQIAATITFGNFYILSSNQDEDKTLNAGDTILVFNENDVPGRIFKYVYGDLGLNVTYTSSVDFTKSAINQDYTYDNVRFDYIYTAEPVVSATNQVSNIYCKVSDDFTAKSGALLTQASVFIDKNSNRELVDSFLNKLKSDIKSAIEDPTIVKNALSKYGSPNKQVAKFGINADLAEKVLTNNGISIDYKNSKDLKDGYLKFIKLFPQLGITELNEEIYY